MALKDYLPVVQAKSDSMVQTIPEKTPGRSPKLFKSLALSLGFQGYHYNRTTFESSPYNFQQIIDATDTDSYIKQGFTKYRELMWKESWNVVSENPDTVQYVYDRFELMELVMKRPLQDLFIDIGDQLIKFDCVYLAKFPLSPQAQHSIPQYVVHLAEDTLNMDSYQA